jgi:hypothetical protein
MHTKTKKDSKETLFQSQKEKNYNEITKQGTRAKNKP